ncbi:MAG: anhydro-N-acetylmuramic acid kinase, partial [Candidatus Omnitrophica bacterium]|nr:anhydro-N-acetylmuramic acid kinase [Candidatus Omnitrophota bacterium]
MKKIALGLMSGTSGDGVSLALVCFRNRSFKLLDYKTDPYPPALSNTILQAATLHTSELSQLNMRLGHFFANVVLKFIRKSGTGSRQIAVIGSHGQTVYHGPGDRPPNTFQIGEPSVLAERTGIPVVADFRMLDIAAGGQGAP